MNKLEPFRTRSPPHDSQKARTALSPLAHLAHLLATPAHQALCPRGAVTWQYLKTLGYHLLESSLLKWDRHQGKGGK